MNFFSTTTGIASEKSYPTTKQFYNTVTGHTISDNKYEYVLNVWKAFKMNTLKDYHDLYLKGHVSLLVCLFETYWKEPILLFESDPAHCLSISGFSSDAVLRFSSVNLKLVADIEKYQFVKRTRSGWYFCDLKGDAGANNNFLKLNCANKPASCIIHLDVNNFYGHSEIQVFPT